MPKKYFDKLIFVMLAAALLSAVVLASMLSVGENSRIMRSSVFSRVSLVGTYRIDGGGWRLLAGNYDKEMQAVTHKTVEFRGHFNKDIAENLLLMLRIQYMEVKIDINGEEVFSFGAKDRLHRLSKSEGDVWQWFVSPGIKTTDDVHIILRDVYGNKFLPKEKHFFENIYFGHGDALYRKIFGSGGLPTLLALFITLLGVAELFTALLFCLFHQKGIRKITFIAAF
ncbi:MAG: hypothetical protein Q4F74_04730, partial [Synergistaceae bacterium]|nr:hypothetical protein [Synergistaceae bacterium]